MRTYDESDLSRMKYIAIIAFILLLFAIVVGYAYDYMSKANDDSSRKSSIVVPADETGIADESADTYEDTDENSDESDEESSDEDEDTESDEEEMTAEDDLDEPPVPVETPVPKTLPALEPLED